MVLVQAALLVFLVDPGAWYQPLAIVACAPLFVSAARTGARAGRSYYRMRCA